MFAFEIRQSETGNSPTIKRLCPYQKRSQCPNLRLDHQSEHTETFRCGSCGAVITSTF